MKVIVFGHKACGKSAVGKLLAEKLGRKFVDLDDLTEEIHLRKNGEKLCVREIHERYGKDYFRKLEKEAVKEAAEMNGIVLALGGGTLSFFDNEERLKRNSLMVFLNEEFETLFERAVSKGIPAFLNKKDPWGSFEKIFKERNPHYKEIADISVDIAGMPLKEIAEKILQEIKKKGIKWQK